MIIYNPKRTKEENDSFISSVEKILKVVYFNPPPSSHFTDGKDKDQIRS